MVNKILLIAVAAWAVAQLLKLLISTAVYHRFDINYLFTGGGMPSSHTALVCSCAVAAAFETGVDSPLFAVAAVLAVAIAVGAFLRPGGGLTAYAATAPSHHFLPPPFRAFPAPPIRSSRMSVTPSNISSAFIFPLLPIPERPAGPSAAAAAAGTGRWHPLPAPPPVPSPARRTSTAGQRAAGRPPPARPARR